MITSEKEFVSVKEFASSTGIGQGFLRRVASALPDFPCIFVGRKLLIHSEKASEYLIKNREAVRNL